MNPISIIVVIFSVIGAFDYILGNRLGLGVEFERGFKLLGTMALSMIGMITISPVVGNLMTPCLSFVHEKLGVDPSIIPAVLFANDMGGATLAKEFAQNEKLGMFNALIVSSMMGCTFSFTIPLALQCVDKKIHRELMAGLMCGIVTIPIGCFIVGLFLNIGFQAVVTNILPLIVFSGIIAAGLLLFPNFSIKVFYSIGIIIKAVIIFGLILGIIKFLTGIEIIKGLVDIEEGAYICINSSIVMSGMFPLISILQKILSKNLVRMGSKMRVNATSALGLISTLATNVTTLGMMDKMDMKGIILNSAFAVSAAFTFAGHLAFTLAFDQSYLFPMIGAKLISGVSSLVFANIIYRKVRY